MRSAASKPLLSAALDASDDQVRLLTSLSQEWPFLIVVEDLHWASDQTISLLTHLHKHKSTLWCC